MAVDEEYFANAEDDDGILNQFSDDIVGYHPYDGWESFERTIKSHRTFESKEDARSYLPTPVVLEQRKLTQRWLREHEFDERIQDSIMLKDWPPINMVIRMTKKYGTTETQRRILGFLDD